MRLSGKCSGRGGDKAARKVLQLQLRDFEFRVAGKRKRSLGVRAQRHDRERREDELAWAPDLGQDAGGILGGENDISTCFPKW